MENAGDARHGAPATFSTAAPRRRGSQQIRHSTPPARLIPSLYKFTPKNPQKRAARFVI